VDHSVTQKTRASVADLRHLRHLRKNAWE
jgi:hypothetical protein